MAKSLSGSTTTLHDFSVAVSQALESVKDATYEQIDRGLDRAMNYMRDKLVEATPVESGLTHDSWKGEDKYKNVRYINNTRVNEKGIPVVNLLEYGKKGKPFVRKTMAAEQQRVIDIIKGEIEHGNTE